VNNLKTRLSKVLWKKAFATVVNV